jgi:hypothetical protein
MNDTGSGTPGTPDDAETPDAVTTRASGRPPEEEQSDDPEHQAEVILEESEERTVKRQDGEVED